MFNTMFLHCIDGHLYPWLLLHSQEEGSRQRRTNAPGQFTRFVMSHIIYNLLETMNPNFTLLWAFTGHGPIIPKVAFLMRVPPIKDKHPIANPCFHIWIPRSSESSQPSFCVCTSLRISLGWYLAINDRLITIQKLP